MTWDVLRENSSFFLYASRMRKVFLKLIEVGCKKVRIINELNFFPFVAAGCHLGSAQNADQNFDFSDRFSNDGFLKHLNSSTAPIHHVISIAYSSTLQLPLPSSTPSTKTTSRCSYLRCLKTSPTAGRANSPRLPHGRRSIMAYSRRRAKSKPNT